MIGYQVIVDNDILDAIADTAQRSPTLMQTAMRRQLTRSKRRVLGKLREVPSRLPTHPFVWSYNAAANARARRWWFANLPDGEGGRYKRTGRLPRAWKAVETVSPYEGLYEVVNPAAGADYVYGTRQVPSHTTTGWVFAPRVIADERALMEDVLIETWFTVTDPTGGVSR